ncbi:MAG: hypothetical protein ACM35H_00970, partial [Bacteroidota bacterium]
MRYAIAAFQEAERTIVTGRLDEGTLTRLARRHGRTPAPAGEPGRPAAAPELAGRSALPVEAPSSVALTAPPVPAMPGDDEGDLRLPSLQTPLREIYTLFVADKSGTSWEPEAIDDAWKALELFEACSLVDPVADRQSTSIPPRGPRSLHGAIAALDGLVGEERGRRGHMDDDAVIHDVGSVGDRER